MPYCINCGTEVDEVNTLFKSCSEPASASATGTHSGSTGVVITDFDMPFWSMVLFMLKLALASIPAIAILALAAYLIMAFLEAAAVNP